MDNAFQNLKVQSTVYFTAFLFSSPFLHGQQAVARRHVQLCLGVSVPSEWAERVEGGARRDHRAGRSHALSDAASGDRARGAPRRRREGEGQVRTQVHEGRWIERHVPFDPRGLYDADRRARGAVPPGARAERARVGQDEPRHRLVCQGTQVGRHPLNSSSQTLNY